MAGQYAREGDSYAHSGQSTAYGSPNGSHWMVDQYASDQQYDPYQQQEVGLGIGYVSVLFASLSMDKRLTVMKAMV